MGLISDYYLDAATLASATKVFLDSGLTVTAPDGYYGADGIYRTVAGGAGVLTAGVVACPDCLPCPVSSNGSLAATGLYSVGATIPVGSGAILVTFNPGTTPHGILATFNSVQYNAVSSPIDGYHAALTAGRATYLGDTAGDCTPTTLDGSPYAGVPDYNFYDGAFYATGLQSTVFVQTGDISFSTGSPGSCVMVIPKPFTSAATLTVQVSVPVSCAVSASLDISCPSSLPTFQSSDIGGVCQDETNNTYYHAPVNGSAGFPGLYDWVFEDANGVTPLPDGVYIADNGLSGSSIEVEDGVVISVILCVGYLLDTYPGAAAGYSVRRLATATTTLLRVRRDTGGAAGDDDEANVSYDSNNELSLDSPITPDTGSSTTLGEFVGLGSNPDGLASPADAFVVTWTDQSGNANDATQATLVDQPQVITAGVIEVDNGKPALNMTGTTEYLSAPIFYQATTAYINAYYVHTNTTFNGNGYLVGTDQQDRGFMSTQFSTDAGLYAVRGAFTSITTPATLNQQYVRVDEITRTSLDIYQNSTLGATGVDADADFTMPTNNLLIGTGVPGNVVAYFRGYMQEVIFYAIDKSGSRTSIETDINTFYSIYP